MVVRNYKKLFWRYIDWPQVSIYIDDLKSRKYRAFIDRVIRNNQHSYWLFIKLPIVILFALKQTSDAVNLSLNDFERGYLLFCCSKMNHIDISFFYYYRNDSKNKLIKWIKDLVYKIYYLLLIIFLETYIVYLKYLISIASINLYPVNSARIIEANSQINKSNYYLFLDIRSYVHSLYLLAFLKRISFPNIFLNALSHFLNLSYNKKSLDYFNVGRNSLFLEKNRLIKKILKIFILHTIYELSVILKSSSTNKLNINKVVGFYDNDFLLFFYFDNHDLIFIKETILYLFSGIDNIMQMEKIQVTPTLLQGVCMNLFVISATSKVYPFSLMIKPSLKSQFFFMKRLSLILYNSKSMPLFVLNIRLNMLIYLWSNVLLQKKIKKVLYLLDYLMNLKLSFFDSSRNDGLSLNIKLFDIIGHNYRYSSMQKKESFSFLTTLYNKKYYKSYFIAKLFWVYKLKCENNLREAI